MPIKRFLSLMLILLNIAFFHCHKKSEHVKTRFPAFAEPWQLNKIQAGDKVNLLGIFAPDNKTVFSPYRFARNMEVASFEWDESQTPKPGVPFPCELVAYVPSEEFEALRNLVTHTDDRVYMEWDEKRENNTSPFQGPPKEVASLTTWRRPQDLKQRLRVKIVSGDSCCINDTSRHYEDLPEYFSSYRDKNQYLEIVVPEKYWFRIFRQVNAIRDPALEKGFKHIGIANENKEKYYLIPRLN